MAVRKLGETMKINFICLTILIIPFNVSGTEVK